MTSPEPIETSEGYLALHTACANSKGTYPDDKSRFAKLAWAVERAQHYAEKTGLSAGDILTAWERQRNYWHQNYYQDAKQPRIHGDAVRIFQSRSDLLAAIGDDGFRCPYCHGISTDPYECNSGEMVDLINDSPDQAICNWKSYGLFRDLGKGTFVFVKDLMKIDSFFMPVAWTTNS